MFDSGITLTTFFQKLQPALRTGPQRKQGEKQMATKRALADVVGEMHRARRTGLLSIVVKSTGNHFKMFFREGDVYYITCADSRYPDCLAAVEGFEFSECFFVPDIQLVIREKNIPPTADIIRLLAAAAKTVELQSFTRNGDRPPVPADGDGLVRILDGLKTALIRQIGPVGERVFARIEEKWRPLSPLTRERLQELASLLKEEIDDRDGRNAFVAEANRIIA